MKRRLTRGDLLVALALEAGEALSAREVATQTGLSERAVVTIRQRLVDAGSLELIEPGAGCRAPRFRRPGDAIYGVHSGRDGVFVWGDRT